MKKVGLVFGLFLGLLVVVSLRHARAEPFAAGVHRKVDGKIERARITGFVVTFPGGTSRECVLVQGDSLQAPVAVTCDWP